jgi:hypothetical protein
MQFKQSPVIQESNNYLSGSGINDQLLVHVSNEEKKRRILLLLLVTILA